MGCDIHMYPEYARGGEDRWNGFGGRINPGRDYDLFGKIAGVRGDGAMFPVRGLPDSLSYHARGDNQLYVSDTGGEGYASSQAAERWVADGLSVYTDDSKHFVTNPDWHTHTWLTVGEFRSVLEAESRWPHDDDYWALLAACEELERRGNVARLVIWFDN